MEESERAAIKEAIPPGSQVCRRHVETSTGLQQHAVSLFIYSSACHSPICVPLTTAFITGVIDHLIYWWLQEVEKAVVLLLHIIAGCFYGGIIAPYCLLVVDKRHSKGVFCASRKACFLCCPACLSACLRPF